MGRDANTKYWQSFGDNPDPCQKRQPQEIVPDKLNIFQNKYVLSNFQLQEKVRLDFNFPFDYIETALYFMVWSVSNSFSSLRKSIFLVLIIHRKFNSLIKVYAIN